MSRPEIARFKSVRGGHESFPREPMIQNRSNLGNELEDEGYDLSENEPVTDEEGELGFSSIKEDYDDIGKVVFTQDDFDEELADLDAEKKIAELKDMLAEKEDEIGELENALAKARSGNTPGGGEESMDAKRKIKKLETANRRLTSELEDSQNDLSNEKKRGQKLHRNLTDLQFKMTEAAQAFQSEKEDLEAQFRDLKQASASDEGQDRSTQRSIAKLEKENKQLVRNLRSANSFVENLESQVRDLKGEVEGAKFEQKAGTAMASRRGQIAANNVEMDMISVKRKLMEVERERDSLKRRYNHSEEYQTSINDQVGRLQEEMEAQRKQFSKIKQALDRQIYELKKRLRSAGIEESSYASALKRPIARGTIVEVFISIEQTWRVGQCTKADKREVTVEYVTDWRDPDQREETTIERASSSLRRLSDRMERDLGDKLLVFQQLMGTEAELSDDPIVAALQKKNTELRGENDGLTTQYEEALFDVNFLRRQMDVLGRTVSGLKTDLRLEKLKVNEGQTPNGAARILLKKTEELQTELRNIKEGKIDEQFKNTDPRVHARSGFDNKNDPYLQDRLSDTISKLRERCRELGEENRDLKETIDSTDLDKLKQDLSGLKRENIRLSTDGAMLKEKANKLHLTRQDLDREAWRREELQSKLASENDKTTILRQELEELQGERTRNLELRGTIETLQATISEQVNTVDDLREQLADTKEHAAKLEALKSQIHEVINQKDKEYREQMQALTEHATKEKEKNKHLMRQIEQMTAEIDRLHYGQSDSVHNDYKHQIQQRDNALGRLRTSLQEAKHRNVDTAVNLENEQETHRRSAKQAAEFKRRWETEQKTVRELQEKIVLQSADIASWDAKYRNQKKHIAVLKHENKDIGILRRSLSVLQKEINDNYERVMLERRDLDVRIRKLEGAVKRKDGQVKRLSEALQAKDSELQRLHSGLLAERHRCQMILQELEAVQKQFGDAERDIEEHQDARAEHSSEIAMLRDKCHEGDLISQRLQQTQMAMSTLQTDLDAARREINMERQSNAMLQDHIERQEEHHSVINDRIRTLSRTTGQFQDFARTPTAQSPMAGAAPPPYRAAATAGSLNLGGDMRSGGAWVDAPSSPGADQRLSSIQQIGTNFISNLQSEVTSEFLKYQNQTREAAANAFDKLTNQMIAADADLAGPSAGAQRAGNAGQGISFDLDKP